MELDKRAGPGAWAPDPEPARDDALRFVLWPHRALGRSGTRRVLGGVGLAMLGPALIALGHGLGPVTIALVASFLAFAAALLASNRSGADGEVIELEPGRLRILRRSKGATSAVAELDPYWTRVEMGTDYYLENRLRLRQSARTIEVGRFLSPPEREHLARELSSALSRFRSPMR